MYSLRHKVFLLIFLLTLVIQILFHISSQGLIVYLSKYVYHSDIVKIAHHTKYLGLSSLMLVLLVPFVGCLFDRYSA